MAELSYPKHAFPNSFIHLPDCYLLIMICVDILESMLEFIIVQGKCFICVPGGDFLFQPSEDVLDVEEVHGFAVNDGRELRGGLIDALELGGCIWDMLYYLEIILVPMLHY